MTSSSHLASHTTPHARMGVTLRPIADGDMNFLFRLYASTREEEMALVDWTDEQCEAFLRSQFEAQHSHYQTHLADSDFSIIECEGNCIGRLYVGRWDDEIRVIDIALLPEHRGGGLGSSLLKSILAEATEAKKPVRIHVEKNNPAMRLYLRLGFIQLEDRGVYDFMEWTPDEK